MTDGLSYDQKRKIRSMAESLAARLVDEDTIRKYGTSFQEGMTHDFVKSLEKRYLVLTREFDQIDTDENGTISKEELKNFFQKRMNQGKENKCDDKYIDRLFFILDRNQDERITPEEFIISYLELEQKLKMKMKKLALLNKDLEDSLREYSEKLNEESEETTNENGVCENASLSITLYEARDLHSFVPGLMPNSFVEFCLEGKKQQSSVVQSSSEPIFNEDFTFPITKRNEELIVTIFDHNDFSGSQEIGKININLELFEHQLKNENWYSLNGEEGASPDGNGSIRLRLRYIYSWKKYYSNLVDKTKDQIRRLKKDIQDIKKYQKELEEPFGLIKSGDVNTIIDSRLFEKSEDIVEYINSTRQSVYVRGAGSNYPSDNIVHLNDKKEDLQWGTEIRLIWAVLFFSICLTFCHRGDFLGLATLFATLIIFLRNNKNDYDTHLKNVNIAFIGSAVFDLLWVLLNIGSWGYPEVESKFICGFIFAIHLFNIVAKIGMYFLLRNQIQKFSKSRANQIKYNL